MISYLVSYLTMASIYGVASLALNIQWGFTGLMNFGLGAFYMLGAYTSALLTSPSSPEHIGGFGMPFILGLIGAAAISGIIAYLLSFPALRLSGGFFAIAMLAIMETIRLIVQNEGWLTNGIWGLRGIPTPLRGLFGAKPSQFLYMGIAMVVLVGTYYFVERSVRSPWGRILAAIREDESMCSICGKNVWEYKMQSFVVGSMVMGIAGAIYAHYINFISPASFTPLMSTFIVWLMVLLGGSGSNRGVVLGAFVVWGVWIGSEFLIGSLPSGMATRAGFIRMFILGFLLDIILVLRPQGLIGREDIVSKL